MTEKVVWHVVKEFATKVGIGNLAPYDLRRTPPDSAIRLEQMSGR
jgi:hypothetical protein